MMAVLRLSRETILLLAFFIVVQITEKTRAEDAAFNVCVMLRKGATCNFTINAHSVPAVTSYKINFGDNSEVTFTDRTTVTPHVYSNVGVYNAVLTFVGAGKTVTKKVTVKEAIVNATVKMSSFLCIVGEKLTFSKILHPNISSDSYYKLGKSSWLMGNEMQCNYTGNLYLAIFIENGISAVLMKCLVNVTAIQVNVTWSPLPGITNQTVNFTATATPSGPYKFMFLFYRSVAVNCTNGVLPYVFSSENRGPGHEVDIIVTDGKSNAAKITKNVVVSDPLIGPLVIECSKMVGTGMLANFAVKLSESNVSYIYNYGDSSPLVNITSNNSTHVFTQKGKYNVHITAKGLVNEISSVCAVSVIEAIQGLSCAQKPIATILGQPTALGWVLENGTEFTIKFQIDISLPTYIVGNLTAQDLLVVYKQHNYTAIGEYSVQFYAWNLVSNVSAVCNVVVQEAIGLLELELVYPDECVEMNQDVTAKVTVNGTRPIIEYDFGNGTIYNSSSTQVIQNWKMYGHFDIKITARNNVSSKVLTRKIFIPKPVVDLESLQAETTFTKLTTNTTINIRIGKGSDFKCNITYGDKPGHALQYCYSHTYFKDKVSLNTTPFENLVLYESYVYPAEGWYEVKVFCFNRRSNVSASLIAHVLKPITEFSATPLTPQMLGTNFKASFTMVNGTNVTVEYYLNNVVANSIIVTDSNGSTLVEHTKHYSTIGHFTGWFRAKNLVSEFNSTSYTFTIQDAITDLSCDAYSNNPFSPLGLPSRCTNKSAIFAVEYPITLPAKPNKGTNLTCYYTFGDGMTNKTADLSVVHKYALLPIEYNTTVTCFNLVSSVSCCYPLTLKTTVKSLTVTNDGPKKFKHPITFTVNVAEYGNGTCFTLDYSDGTPIDVYGLDHCKTLTFPQGQQYFSVVGEGISSFTATHAYVNVNEYYVKINATNDVSCFAVENQAVSVLKECHYPNVTIKDANENMTAAPIYYRSETKQYSLDVQVYCEVSPETNYSWKVYKVRNFNNVTLDTPEEVIVPNAKLTNPILTVFSRALDYGTYKLEVTVNMVKTIGVRTVASAYIGITCTPYIMANIKDGNKLKRMVGNTLSVDGSTSFDPDHDMDDHRNMTFYWFCRKMSEAALNTNDPTSVGIISMPDKNADPNTLNKGGCFGTGVGRLPVTTEVMDLDTKLPGIQTGLNNSMVITLVVVKNDSCGIRVGHFDQYIELTKDVIPIISTTCIQNCLPRINPNDKLSYSTNCSFCKDKTKFKWTVGKLKSCDGNPTDPANMDVISDDKLSSMMYGDSSSLHMAFMPGVLDSDACYTCTLKATNPDTKFGENSFTFQTNEAPKGGSIIITPLVGITLNTTFTATFSNWIDSDVPLVYSCGKWDGTTFELFVQSSEQTLSMKLPSGNPAKDNNMTLRCRVADRQGATTTLDKVIKVTPLNYTSTNLLNFLNHTVTDPDGALSKAVQSGDITGILLITNSVSTAMDLQYAEGQAASKNNLTAAQQKTIDDQAKRRAELRATVMSVLSNIDVETLYDATTMGVACNSLTAAYEDLDSRSQELAVTLISKTSSHILSATPLDTSLSTIVDAATMAVSTMGQVATSSAKMATFNSSDEMFDISGASGNSNNTGMVSGSERGKERVLALLNIVKAVSENLLKWLQPGEKEVVMFTPTLNITIKKIFFKDLATTNLGDGLTKIKFPSASEMGLINNDVTKDFLSSLLTSSKKNLLTWTNTSNQIKSQGVGVEMNDPSGNPLDTSKFASDATIIIPRDDSQIPKKEERFLRTYKETDGMVQQMQIHVLNMSSPNMDNNLQLIPKNDTIKLEVYLQYGERAYPEEGKYLFNWTLPDFSSCSLDSINDTQIIDEHKIFMVDSRSHCTVDPYKVFVPFDLVNKTGLLYFSVVHTTYKQDETTPTPSARRKRAIPGVTCGSHGRMKRSCVIIPPPPPTPPTEPPEGALREVGTRAPNLDFMGNPMNMNDTIKYDVRIYQTNCMYFDNKTQSFTNAGCKVSNETREDKVVCKCNHFTSFGSDFFVAPNPIDFDKVFSADLSKNPVVLSVVCGLFGLYLLLVVFARRADKRDEKKTGVTPLPANAAPGSHSYLISIHTGVRFNAGTTANVYVVLSGEEGESPPILLKDPERPLFTRGADNSLVMTIPKDIGKITHLRVWHDNTGVDPSWYLSRMMLEDLHDHNKVYFVFERWLAVEWDDGRVDIIRPVASDKELTQFNHLFVSKTVRELGDGHLWFSIIARPPQSVFTRVQRLSCALSLLYCTMITSCMFYNTGGKGDDPTYILYLGSLKIDLKQMIIGLQSSLIVFPVNLALMQIFRKIRPDDTNVEKAEDITEGFDDIYDDGDETALEEEKKKKKKKEKKGLHPRWRYVAWVICMLSMLTSATFTVFYSLSWGPILANKWLTAFVLSFFQSVLLIQPVKVIFAAIVFALIIKKPIENEEETNKDAVTEFAVTKDFSEKTMMSDDYMMCDGSRIGPPDELLLMVARQKRLKEIQMSIILREIFAFLVFMGVLLLVAYGNRDPNAYLLRNALNKDFVFPSVGDKVSFNSAVDVDSFWHWCRETLIPTLYPGPWYNKKPVQYKGFLDDRFNYLVGISRLRQERVRKDTCTVVPIFKHFFPTCIAGFSLSAADEGDYDIAWKYLNKTKNAAKRKRRSVEEQFSFVKEDDKLVDYAKASKALKRKRRAIDPVYVSTSGRQARKRDRGQSKKYTVLESAILPDGSIMSCPTRWQYHNLLELRGFPYWGMMNFYSGGGFPADLGYDYNTALTVVADTNSHNWLDAQSRAVFVEFTIYNANVNLFASAFLFMEFLPNGGAFPTASFVVSRLYSYVGPFAKLILAMEVFMLLFMFYFMYREVKLMYKQGREYFHGFWNWLELLLILLEFIMVILFFARIWETDKNFIKLHHNPKDFVSFQYAAAADQTLTYVIGLLVFLVTLRFLKLLRFNKKMAFIGVTISIIAKPIGLFMISFSIIFFAYNCFGVLIFGHNSAAYKDNLSAAVTQMRILLGDFDYYSLTAVQPIFGPIYFFTYMYLIVFFLMNMFVAIINDSFNDVKELEDELSNEYEMVDFIMGRLKNQLTFMKKGPQTEIKTPYGPGSAVPFWEYKRRKDSISSDSEFSCTTNMTAIKAKRDMKLMEEDLGQLIKRLTEIEIDEVETDQAFVKIAQIYNGRASNSSDSESETDTESHYCSTLKSVEDDASSISTHSNID